MFSVMGMGDKSVDLEKVARFNIFYACHNDNYRSMILHKVFSTPRNQGQKKGFMSNSRPEPSGDINNASVQKTNRAVGQTMNEMAELGEALAQVSLLF
jgi:hypothetical protein